jgi:hypothetical protein
MEQMMTSRELLLRWIGEAEEGAERMRSLARQCKAEAQRLEEKAMRLRSSVPPEQKEAKAQ